MNIIVRALSRAVGVLILSSATFYIVSVAAGPMTGANIGAGIAAFLATALVAAVWGFLDGRTIRPVLAALWPWLIAAALVGLGATFLAQLGGRGGFDWNVWRSDIGTVWPFHVGLVSIPALLGIALGHGRARGTATAH